jgi:hypothetical protein
MPPTAGTGSRASAVRQRRRSRTPSRRAGQRADSGMAISRAERRQAHRDRVVELFGEKRVDRALDLLELLEFAWHDCYSEVSPPEDVIEDVLLLSRGDLGQLISASLLALTDWRDTRVAADAMRP